LSGADSAINLGFVSSLLLDAGIVKRARELSLEKHSFTGVYMLATLVDGGLAARF
jgi:hypothetical protein